MEKGVYELQADIFYLSVCEREKKNSFGIIVIIFKAYKKCKSPI